MKNELLYSFLRDGSIDFGNGIIGPSSVDKAYFNSKNEVPKKIDRKKIVLTDSGLRKALGLRLVNTVLPVAGVLSLAISCWRGEVNQAQQGISNNNNIHESSGSELPSPTPESWYLTNDPATSAPTPPSPSDKSTEIPMPTATVTPKPPPKEAATLFPTQTSEPTPKSTPELLSTKTPTLSPTKIPTRMPSPTPKIEDVVKPILFVPANLSKQEDDLANINKAMREAQLFYARELDGKTFKYENVVLIQGQKDLKFYCPKTISEKQCIQDPGKAGADSGDIYSVIKDIRTQDPTFFNKGQVIVIFWVGGYGYAGGSQSSPDSGFAALGDWTLDAIGGRYAKRTDTGGCRASPYAIAFCRDNPFAVIHELGHAFGLPHPSIDNANRGDANFWTLSVMDSCEWPECRFLNSDTNPEKQRLIKSPFMHVVMDFKK